MDSSDYRNDGGLILFIEFCDWAIQKKVDSGAIQTTKAKGIEFAQKRTGKANTTAGKPDSHHLHEIHLKSSEKNQNIEKHSDYRSENF